MELTMIMVSLMITMIISWSCWSRWSSRWRRWQSRWGSVGRGFKGRVAGWNLSVNSDHPSSLSLMRGPLDRYDEDFYDDEEEENGDVHFLYHSNDDSDDSGDETSRSDRSQVGLSCKLHEQTDVSLHFSSANWQVYLQSSLLHFSSTYQAGPVTWLQQSTKSATQCKADKEDSRCAFWWKKNPFNHSTTPACSDFKLFLRICVFVASPLSTWSVPSQRWCSVSPQDWRFPIWQRRRQAQLQAQLQHSYVSQLRAAQLQQHSTVTCHSYRMGLHYL